MNQFLVGLGLFFAAHSLFIINRPWRDAMVGRCGEIRWTALCSVASLIGFGLLCHGDGLTRADPTVLYTRRPQRGVVLGAGATRNDLLAVLAGLTICLLFIFWLHRALVGASLV